MAMMLMLLMMMVMVKIGRVLASRRPIRLGLACLPSPVGCSADEDNEEWRLVLAAQGFTILGSINWVAKRLWSDSILSRPPHIEFLVAWKKPGGGVAESNGQKLRGRNIA
jgi:hypothetical protein